jgi:hypothetical protein
MNTLHIFDFDDTLVRSDSKVRVKDSLGNIKELSSEEYASYKEKPDEHLDFSDFDTYPKNPEIIEPVFAHLRAAIALSGSENTVILTARSNPGPVKLFLSLNKIPDIHVEAVGSSDPMAKALYILDRLRLDQNIQEVRVFEDNVRNIRTIQKVVSKTGTRLKTNRVRNGILV